MGFLRRAGAAFRMRDGMTLERQRLGLLGQELGARELILARVRDCRTPPAGSNPAPATTSFFQ